MSFGDGCASIDGIFQKPADGLIVPRIALPDHEDLPAEILERFFVAPVAGDVLGEFIHPERDAGFGRIGVAASFVPVPEAPVDEDSESVAREDQIRAAGKVLPMQTKAQTQLVRDPANHDLGSGVPPFDPGHHFASPLAVYDVHQGAALNRRSIRGQIMVHHRALRHFGIHEDHAEIENSEWCLTESWEASQKTSHERDVEG